MRGVAALLVLIVGTRAAVDRILDTGACAGALNHSIVRRASVTARVWVATTHEPHARDSTLFHETARALSLEHATERLDVLVVVECATHRVTLALIDVELTFACTRTSIAERMARIDAVRAADALSLKVAHVLADVDAWRAERRCARPSEKVIGVLVIIACVVGRTMYQQWQ